ncbi:unnamed protein product [Musa hybrid cultivar]
MVRRVVVEEQPCHSYVWRATNLMALFPSNLGQFSGMYRLDLSSNSPEGDITKAHFSRFTNLEHLDVSYNSFNVIIPDNWLLSFDASFIDMSFCRIETKFST